MKYRAIVKQVLHNGIHKVTVDVHENEVISRPLPLPTYIEIEIDESGHAMLYRYQDDGTFCGDTWHETFEDAQDQAAYEYGILEDSWAEVA